MLTKRDYWTITSLILVVVLLFQLLNVTRRSESLDVTSPELQSVTEELTDELPAGGEDR